jgi:hypothetical protein
MSIAEGSLLHLRLFICGVEVPVIGAMVSATEGSPAAAQIEIIPTDRALRLLPRSKIHLFFLDYDEAAYGGVKDSYYKLLFSGELFTISYTKTGFGSRSMVLQCLDDSNFWDTSYLYLLRYANANTGDGAVVQRRNVFLGAGAVFDDILSSPELTVATWASKSTPPYTASVAGSGGLLGGLFSVLELIGGLPGKFVGVTAWHSIQEARVRLMDQLAGDDGETAKKLYELTVFQEWVKDRIGDRGTVISFRDIIEMVNGYTFYGVVPNPVARYHPGSRNNPPWPATLSKGIDDLDPEFRALVEEVLVKLKKKYPGARFTSTYRSLEDRNRIRKDAGDAPYASKKDTKGWAHDWGFAVDIAGHTANIGYKTGQIGYTSESSFKVEAEGVPPGSWNDRSDYSVHKKCQYYRKVKGVTTAEGLLPYLNDYDKRQLAIAVEFYHALRDIIYQDYRGILRWNASNIQDPMWEAAGLKMRTDSGEMKAGGDPVHVEMVGWEDKLGEGYELGGEKSALKEFLEKLGPRERMLTQYFRPDCWFVPPPRCNVIFPEEVNSFSFTRQMMRETTRLQLLTHNVMVGEDAILNQSYFAPNFQKTKSLQEDGIGSVGEQVIYPHEKFSGLVPKMERISDVAIYARLTEDYKISDDEKQLSAQNAEEEFFSVVDDKISKWASQTAAFNFLSHRYSSRIANVSGRFMPRIACGFPALILDKPHHTSDAVANSQEPIHFLGMVRSFTHSLSQSGGNTSVSLSHARSHRNVDETDGLPDDLFAVQVGKANTRTITLTIGPSMSPAEFVFWREIQDAWVNEWVSLGTSSSGSDRFPTNPEVFSRLTITGPEGGKVTDIKVRNLNGSNILELGPKELREGDEPVLDSNGQIQYETIEAGMSQSHLGAAPASRQSYFQSITYSETLGEDGVIIALEDAIRPPWFSDQYGNDRIGSLYEEFFGCDSMLALGGTQDIESATSAISQSYSRASAGGFSAASWIYENTKRTYTTLPQVLGGDGVVGFHQYAVGRYSGSDWTERKLEALVASGEPLEDGGEPFLSTQFNQEEPNTISVDLDPRTERANKARAYQAELLYFRGLRG